MQVEQVLPAVVSTVTAVASMLSFAWYLRGQLGRIAVSLAKIEAAIATTESKTDRNEEAATTAHRRIDNHEVRLALLETMRRDLIQ